MTVLTYQALWRPWGSRSEQSKFSSCLGGGGEAAGETVPRDADLRDLSAKKLSDQGKLHSTAVF